jgi:hypothetical protein
LQLIAIAGRQVLQGVPQIKLGLISLDDLPRDPGRGFRSLHILGQPMSGRFPAFSRLFWQSIRPQPGLHPAMRARMWKPGESGNPAGVSKAYAEAMREISMRARELSLGAERTRRWRQKRQQGVVVVSFDVAPDVTGKLIRFGWLDPNKRDDKEAIARALVELAEKATELEVTPASCST